MRSKSAFILVMVLSAFVLGGILFSVYKVFDKKQESFYQSGYVIDEKSENSEKIYFNSKTNYKRKYNGDVIFKNIEDEKSEISKYSFVYYENKSIGFLNNAVLMDLKSVGSDFIPYYNIKSNYIINYDNKYSIDTAKGNIVFDDFIAKIADNKYLFAGNDLYLKLSGNNEDISYYYFEITYNDGNVIKINSDALNIETISSGSFIYVGNDIKIDLEKGLIYYKDEGKIYLNEINIDSNSNIDIEYEQESSKEQEEPSVPSKKPNVIENVEYVTQTVLDYKNIPHLEILSTNVNSHAIGLEFNVKDPDKLINSDVVISYQNLNNGQIGTEKLNNYNETINYMKDYLASDTPYLVTISTTYAKNETTYSDVLLSRVFTTSSVGINLSKDYITNKEISYNVNLENNSMVTGFTLNLYDQNNNLVRSKEITSVEDKMNITFEDLDSNTIYNAKIENVYIAGILMTSVKSAVSSNKTLKTTPKDSLVVAQPIAISNKKDYNFTFDLSQISDPENSIKSVIYNIYKKEDDSLVKTITKENTGQITVEVDDDLKGYETYYYKAILNINDGEKNIEYETEKSNNFSLDSKRYPTVSFAKETVTSNTIKGKFVITDDDLTIDVTKPMYVIYTDSLGNEKSLNLTTTNTNEDSEKVLPLEIMNLASNDIYTIRLMAYVDTKDKLVPADTIQIGAIKINTAYADTLLVKLTPITLPENKLASEVFNLRINFSIDENITPLSVKENFRKFTVSLYEGYNGSGNYIGNFTLDDYDEVQSYFESKGGILNLANFGKTLTDLQRNHLAQGGIISQKYSLVFSEGYTGDDLVEFKPISANLLNFDISDKLIALLNDDADIDVTLIENNKTYANLNDDTAIGFKITTMFTANREVAKQIKFKINDLTTTQSREFSKDISLTQGMPNPSFDVLFSEDDSFYQRGHSYQISYTVLLDLDDDGSFDYEYPFDEGDITKTKPVVSEVIDVYKQKPSAVIFPWSSNDSSVTLKYKVEDVDNSLEENFDVYYQTLENTDLKMTKVTCDKLNNITSIYDCIKADNLTKNADYKVYLKAKLLDKEVFDIDINEYTFEGVYSSLEGLDIEGLKNENNVSNYTNLFVLKLDEEFDHLTEEDKENAKALKNRVAYYTVELKYTDDSAVNHRYVINNINDVQSISAPYSANIIDYYNNNKKTKSWNNTLSADNNLAKTGYVAPCEDESYTCLYLDYAKLYNSQTFGAYFKKSLNKDIKVSVSALYDSGKIAYDLSSTNNYTFQVLKSANYTNNNSRFYNDTYLYSYDNVQGHMQFHDSSLGIVYYYFNDYAKSRYGFVEDDNDSKMTFINIAFNNLSPNEGNQPYKYVYSPDYKVTNAGVTVNLKSANMPIVAKALEFTTIKENISYKFDKVVPGIKITSAEKALNGVKLRLSLSGLDENILYKEDNTYNVYLEVYNEGNLVKTIKTNYLELTSQSGIIEDGKFTLHNNGGYYYDVTSVTVDGNFVTNYSYDYKTGIISNVEGNEIEVSYKIVINNLESDKSYTLKAYMLKNATQKVYLINLDTTLYNEFAYDFMVNKLNDLEVSNANFTVESISYDQRNLTVTYILSDIMGIDDLTYSICKDGKCTKNEEISCDNAFDKINNSCVSKSGNNYIIKYTIKAIYEDDSDFVYNTNYLLKINAKSSMNEEKEIYSSSSMVRKLNSPEFIVNRTSDYNSASSLSDVYFNVSVKDDDYVITDHGTYKATLSLVSGATSEEVFKSDTTYSALNDEVITYNNLLLNSEYDLKIEYKTYLNSEDCAGLVQEYSIQYPIYTVNNYNVSAGVIDYDFNSDKNNFILKLFYSSNVAMHIFEDATGNISLDANQKAYVGGVNYSIRRKEGSSYASSGMVIFNKTSKNYEPGSSVKINAVRNINGNLTSQIDYTFGNITSLSSDNEYYQILLPHDTLDSALYTLDITFYLAGNLTKNITSEDACYNDSVSNLWIKYNNGQSECLKYNNITYTTDKLYGGE